MNGIPSGNDVIRDCGSCLSIPIQGWLYEMKNGMRIVVTGIETCFVGLFGKLTGRQQVYVWYRIVTYEEGAPAFVDQYDEATRRVDHWMTIKQFHEVNNAGFGQLT